MLNYFRIITILPLRQLYSQGSILLDFTVSVLRRFLAIGYCKTGGLENWKPGTTSFSSSTLSNIYLVSELSAVSWSLVPTVHLIQSGFLSSISTLISLISDHLRQRLDCIGRPTEFRKLEDSKRINIAPLQYTDQLTHLPPDLTHSVFL